MLLPTTLTTGPLKTAGQGKFKLILNCLKQYQTYELNYRVKIPLADLGVKSTDLVGLFSFLLNGNVPAGGTTLLFDGIKDCLLFYMSILIIIYEYLFFAFILLTS